MLPQEIKSLWMATTPPTDYLSIERGVTADAVIVGAGLAGLAIAYSLQKQGFKVAILDAHRIATGTSGNTTAKITSQHGLIYSHLRSGFGRAGAKTYAEANEWAIAEIERTIEKEHIHCDFFRLPAYAYSVTEEGRRDIDRESEVVRDLGLPLVRSQNIPYLPPPVTGVIGFDNQAYFHPRKFCLKLAEIIEMRGGLIFEDSEVLDIREEEGGCLVITKSCNLSARYAVIATNFPFIGIDGLEKRLGKSHSFVLAARSDRPIPYGMFITAGEDRLSFRPHYTGREEWFLIGGESHKLTDAEDDFDHFKRLEEIASERFVLREIGYKWAAEDTMTPDAVAAIGRVPEARNIFVATGFNKWGMTTSFVSARIITDLIAGKETLWTDLYDPQRLRESALARMGRDALSDISRAVIRQVVPEKISLSELKVDNDAGKVIEYEGENLAVYKDTDGKLHIRSATCMHLGCTVGWNDEDKTWDCPCHGSRYDKFGKVLRGPTHKPLRETDIGEE